MAKILHKFDDDDVMVKLSPFLDEDGSWTGELTVGIVASEDNALDDDDYFHVMNLASMLCAAVPLMEESTNFREELYNYTQTVLKEDNKPSIERVENSNIVKLNFEQ